MVETAPANADDAGVPEQRRAPKTPSPVVGPSEAARLSGLSVSSVQRRVDAWLKGDRSDWALMGGRGGATPGKAAMRYVNHDDLMALVAQLRGEAPPGRHQQPGPV